MKLLHFEKSNTAFWGIYDEAKAVILTNRKETSNLPTFQAVISYFDGEVRQSANTNRMIHPIDELVEWLSKGMTLNPGDVIATGTPSGVGMAFKPQRLLQSGSTIEIVIEGIGRLKNVVE